MFDNYLLLINTDPDKTPVPSPKNSTSKEYGNITPLIDEINIKLNIQTNYEESKYEPLLGDLSKNKLYQRRMNKKKKIHNFFYLFCFFI